MSIRLKSLPGPLELVHVPAKWDVANESDLLLKAAAKTDLFFAPDGGTRIDNAPAALFSTRERNFTLSARVQVDFAGTFDAGVLLIRGVGDTWAKLCFEYSPFKQPMVVSVVTRGTSDDCNSTVIARNSVYLRITRQGQAFSFHYSTDGKFWHLVRHFALGADEEWQVGFSAQSPTGEGCTARFSELEYQARLLADIRSGA